MRIAYCSHNTELQGAPIQLLRLADSLQNRGHTSVFFAPHCTGPLTDILTDKHIAYEAIPGLFDEQRDLRKCANMILRTHPDLVVVNTVLGGHIVQAIKQHKHAVPVAWIIHESERDQLQMLRTSIHPDIFAMANAIIFVSSQTRDVYNGMDTGNMHVIHNGIDANRLAALCTTDARSAVRRSLDIPEDALLITLIGSFCPRKGQREFIAACVRVLETLPDRSIHFLLVGKTEHAYESYVRNALSLAVERGMEHHFHLAEPQEAVHAYYAATDIFVSNSFIESAPLVVLEAMACGLPIVAGASYGVREQLVDNESGLLFLPGNVSLLTEKLLHAIEHPDLRAQLGAQAAKRVREIFSEEQMTNRYETLFRAISGLPALPHS